MIVHSITQIHQFVRERMPDLGQEDVCQVADHIWREAHGLGYASGHYWQQYLLTISKNMSDYYELVQG